MQNNVHILQPVGVLDGNTTNELRNQIRESIQTGKQMILVDLQEVNFMNSSGIGALVAALKDVKKAGGGLFLCSLSDQVRIIFQLTKMERVFKPLKDRAEFEMKVLQLS
ncbi:MAG: STAS domain-containing protein [Cyanobacteria bacterium P01_F01_bin.150]